MKTDIDGDRAEKVRNNTSSGPSVRCRLRCGGCGVSISLGSFAAVRRRSLTRERRAKQASGRGVSLAVKPQAGARIGGKGAPLLHLFTQEVDHLDGGQRLCRSKGPARHGADVLLELVDFAPIGGP